MQCRQNLTNRIDRGNNKVIRRLDYKDKYIRIRLSVFAKFDEDYYLLLCSFGLVDWLVCIQAFSLTINMLRVSQDSGWIAVSLAVLVHT
jgi:hypothetical protein